MFDNTIILSESHELVIAPNLKAKSSAVKQMILDGVMGEVDKKDEVDWRDLERYKDKETGLWGYKSKQSGEVMIRAKFNVARIFDDGVAGIKHNRKYGFIRADGSFLVEPIFDCLTLFEDGLALVEIEGMWGYLKDDGSYLVEPKNDYISGFKDGFACVEFNYKWGFIRQTDGRYLIETKYDKVYAFQEGFGIVNIGGKETNLIKQRDTYYATNFEGGKWGFIKKDGTYLFEPKFDYVSPFEGGFAQVGLNGLTGRVDTKGNEYWD